MRISPLTATPGAQAALPAVALPSLTAMRWLAAFLVFGFHVHATQYFRPASGTAGTVREGVLGVGATGVSFFFILSGFVLAWSARPGQSVRTFWRRRFARVYPLHAATAGLAVLIALLLVTKRGTLPTAGEALANLLLVHAWAPDGSLSQTMNPVSWSLACEAFFYAVFPALFPGVRRLGLRGLVTAGALCAVAVALVPSLAGDGFHRFPLARLPEFALGVILACLVRRGHWRGPGLPVSFGVLLACYALTTVAPAPLRFAACTLPGFVLVICAAAVADARRGGTWLSGPTLVRLGELSFAFYMVHVLLIRVGEALFTRHPHLAPLHATGAAAALFTLSLLLAWVLYESVEKPAQRLIGGSGRRASPAPRPTTAPRPATAPQPRRAPAAGAEPVVAQPVVAKPVVAEPPVAVPAGAEPVGAVPAAAVPHRAAPHRPALPALPAPRGVMRAAAQAGPHGSHRPGHRGDGHRPAWQDQADRRPPAVARPDRPPTKGRAHEPAGRREGDPARAGDATP